jgi:hypothetical protein
LSGDKKGGMKHIFSYLVVLLSVVRAVAADGYTGELMNLSDGWEFYPGKFLSAGEMKLLTPPGDSYTIPLDQNWAKLKNQGKNLPAMGIGTYYKQIILKNDKTGLNNFAIRVGTVMSAYQLFVNDKLVLRAGNPTPDKQGFKPACGVKTCSFECSFDTINLVLQVSNFYHPSYGGVYQQSKLMFGKAEDVAHYSFVVDFFFFFLFSCFVLLFVLQMVFGFLNRKEHIHFLIATLSIATAFEILKEGDAFWFLFFPDFNVALSDKLWYLIYPFILLVLLITKLSFRDLVNKRIERSFYILYAIILPVFAAKDNTFMFRYSFVPAVVNILCVGYIQIVLIKAVGQHKDYSRAHIISFAILCLAMINDILYAQEIVHWGSFLSVGILIYIVIQSTIILSKFGRSRSLAIKLSHKLEETNRNLEQLVDDRTIALKLANEELVRINCENMELAEQKANMLQTELSKKEREMITAAVSIFQNKKLLSALKEDVFNEKIKYSKDQSAYLSRVVDKYDNMANSFNWELFEKRFTEIHQDFYIHLIKDFPELTTNELKLCAFFRIGLSMKEIAILNYSNYDAVRKSAYRIRKKMGMDEKTELSIFMQGY